MRHDLKDVQRFFISMYDILQLYESELKISKFNVFWACLLINLSTGMHVRPTVIVHILTKKSLRSLKDISMLYKQQSLPVLLRYLVGLRPHSS